MLSQKLMVVSKCLCNKDLTQRALKAFDLPYPANNSESRDICLSQLTTYGSQISRSNPYMSVATSEPEAKKMKIEGHTFRGFKIDRASSDLGSQYSAPRKLQDTLIHQINQLGTL